jgi:hypothetical protein
MEQADRIRAAADARDERVRQLFLASAKLLRVSFPITLWNSRTINGYGCGPRALPNK